MKNTLPEMTTETINALSHADLLVRYEAVRQAKKGLLKQLFKASKGSAKRAELQTAINELDLHRRQLVTRSHVLIPVKISAEWLAGKKGSSMCAMRPITVKSEKGKSIKSAKIKASKAKAKKTATKATSKA